MGQRQTVSQRGSDEQSVRGADRQVDSQTVVQYVMRASCVLVKSSIDRDVMHDMAGVHLLSSWWLLLWLSRLST